MSSSSSALERNFSRGNNAQGTNRIKTATLETILQTSSEYTFIVSVKMLILIYYTFDILQYFYANNMSHI